MSAKATGLVWDLECPKQYGEIYFKSSHKYVLVAYADHADHNGKNIWPAVPTIAKKTGMDDRTVQRLTADLVSIGLLIEDGKGPKGTNKWYLPFNDGGDKLTPRQIDGGDKNENSLGDIPSGDIPSGDKLTPEVKEPELKNINTDEKNNCIEILQTLGHSVFGNNLTSWWNFRRRLEKDEIVITGNDKQMTIKGLSDQIGQFTEAEVFQDKYAPSFAKFGLLISFQE